MQRRSENEQALGAHANFLQHWFRRTRALAAARIGRSPTAPSAWGPRGGMRGLLLIYRPVHRPRCTDGIASKADFAGQRRRARRVLMWYRQYAEFLRKLGEKVARDSIRSVGGRGSHLDRRRQVQQLEPDGAQQGHADSLLRRAAEFPRAPVRHDAIDVRWRASGATGVGDPCPALWRRVGSFFYTTPL